MGRKRKKTDPATDAFNTGYQRLRARPLFDPLISAASFFRNKSEFFPSTAWAFVDQHGRIKVNPKRKGDPGEWEYVLAHCLLHLGFGHFQDDKDKTLWNIACDCIIARFLHDLKIGKRPESIAEPPVALASNEGALYRLLQAEDQYQEMLGFGVGENHGADMRFEPAPRYSYGNTPDWPALFGQGLAESVRQEIRQSAFADTASPDKPVTEAEQARQWFISSYPLLGALAAEFELVDDPIVCRREQISVAAVDAESREIFINKSHPLTPDELRFIIAHELLHVSLRHAQRRQGRDPYYWNVACDYVINGWLLEMGIGEMPPFGALHDPALKGQSAEALYDLIVTDLRRFRKLTTLRGQGLGDILGRGGAEWWKYDDGLSLDNFYRQCLARGLRYHQEQERGFLPAGLIEEIRALEQPPIPWDVELARWFDEYFPPLERRRSYARPSRRQTSSPDIPRPGWQTSDELRSARTYGVVLDTSGSMDNKLLAKALGSMASYSLSHEVLAVRVVYCDAQAYDAGYVPPEDIAEGCKVKGRGGTVLQPGINLLKNAEDFPENGPILIITDGECDRLKICREHAYLMPKGARFPFIPKGPVFRFE